jgi:hypothetical protein
MSSNELLGSSSRAALCRAAVTDDSDLLAEGGPLTKQPAAPEHLTLNETAEWLRCSTRTLQRLLEDGSGPPVIRLSARRLIFKLADLRTWLLQRTRGVTERPYRRGQRSGSSPRTNDTEGG